MNIQEHYQEESQWCWAATCQSALEFYGIKQTQTSIANYANGGINNWTYLWGADYIDGVFSCGCDQILKHFGAIQSTGTSTSMSASQLQSEIAALRPVVVNWSWDSGGGHILLAYGVTGSTVSLMDPLYGPSVNDYSWVCKGGGHTWKWTLRLTTTSLAANNVPRWWLGQFGLTNWNADALADQDADGMPTWQEYIANTDPTRSADVLRTQTYFVNSGVVLSWLSSTNRVYSIEKSTNLAQSAGWNRISTFGPVTGTGTLMSYTNESVSPMEFYRVSTSVKTN